MDDAWPEHLLARNHPVRTWSSRPDAVWETIRQDYLAGTPARDLCDRYAVALSTLRLKAREGGWRRADQADSDLFPADADRWARAEGDEETPESAHAFGDESWSDLADRARFRLRRAIASGRAAEAAAWLRVHERLRALAAPEAVLTGPPPEPESEPEPDPPYAAMDLAAQIGSLARRAARATTDAEFAAIEAGIQALNVCADALTDQPEDDPALDPLDSLDPVFSEPAGPVESSREISSRTRPRPDTPAPPPSSPAPAPGCDAETGRSG